MTQIHLQAQIPTNLAGLRLDQALAKLFPDYSRARLQAWIKAGAVTVDGKYLKPSDKVQVQQLIEIKTALTAESSWEPQSIELDIIHEDENILVINKQPGLVVHPGAGNRDKTLLNALLHHAPNLATLPRAGIVHRLDKNTSGLLVIAKTLNAHQKLIKQLQTRVVKREYQALVNGILISGGTITAPIGRHPIHRTHMAVVVTGKPAITHYRILERYQVHTLLKVQLETGRTHQIRVHLSHIHHPLVGDPTYAGRLRLPPQATEKLKQALHNFKRQALHAWRLELKHPKTEKIISWEAPLPDDMENLLKLLRQDYRDNYNG